MDELRMKITISQYSFQLSEPYQIGHQLTADEARALNVLRSSHIRKAIASQVRQTILDNDNRILSTEILSELQQCVNILDQEFAFGPPQRAPKVSPLDIEIELVARYWADSEAIKSGRVGATNEEIDAWKAKPQVQIEARKRLAIQQEIATSNAI